MSDFIEKLLSAQIVESVREVLEAAALTCPRWVFDGVVSRGYAVILPAAEDMKTIGGRGALDENQRCLREFSHHRYGR